MQSRREDLPFQAHLVVSQCETYTHSQEAVTVISQWHHRVLSSSAKVGVMERELGAS